MHFLCLSIFKDNIYEDLDFHVRVRVSEKRVSGKQPLVDKVAVGIYILLMVCSIIGSQTVRFFMKFSRHVVFLCLDRTL